MKATRCTIDDCEHAGPFTRGMCMMHYTRARRHGELEPIEKVDAPCSVEGCDETARVHGWCPYHYQRSWRTGDPLGSNPRKQRAVCVVAECSHTAHGWGFCQNHYMRWSRGNDPHTLPVLTGPESPRWVKRELLDYDSMHQRLDEQRGKARSYNCAACGCPADEWAYRHTDPTPLISPQGCPYTDDMTAYQPMCRKCHRSYDAAVRQLNDERERIQA